MSAKEVQEATLGRIRWLSACSREAAQALCADGKVSDPPEVHCARFALHIVSDVPLPAGYAWEVVTTPPYSSNLDRYSNPLEHHVRTMAMYAADLDDVGADLLSFCRADPSGGGEPWLNNNEFDKAAIFRFAYSPKALDDDRLLEFSQSDDPAVRHAVATVLEWRPTSYRRQILARLLDDPIGRVAERAAIAAGRSGDPELHDLLKSKEVVHFFALVHANDPRGRATIERWARNDSIDRDDAGEIGERCHAAEIAGSHMYAGILGKLCYDRDWEVRSYAIGISAHAGLIESTQLKDILTMHNAERIAELLYQWPDQDTESIEKLGRKLAAKHDSFPSFESLAAGHADSLDRIRAWSGSAPRLCGAAMRLVPEGAAVNLVHELADSPDAGARVVAAKVIGYRKLTACYPLVLELCVDADDHVTDVVCRVIERLPIRSGLYGIDTAILKSGKKFKAGPIMKLDRMIRRIIAGVL